MMIRHCNTTNKREAATLLGAALLAFVSIYWASSILSTGATTNEKNIHAILSNRTATVSSLADEGTPTDLAPTWKRPPASPACEPHFRAALPDGNWTNAFKFRRLYFYHVRKAGGTNLRFYLEKVAAHHGLEFSVNEYGVAEEPSSHDTSKGATFYVTNLREPVSRSISHFKYEGRWDCQQLITKATFVPTENNARKISTWNQHFGHDPSSCRYTKGKGWVFHMVRCAVDCYSQWFAGLSCPWWDPPANPGPDTRPIRREVPMIQQHAVARKKMLRYNLLVVTERLGDPAYVAALDRLLGVPGSGDRARHPWCELESHYANTRVPLVVDNEMRANLTRQNVIDVGLYREMTGCLDGGGGYRFPEFEDRRFEANETLRVNHIEFVRRAAQQPEKVSQKWMRKFKDNTR